MKRLLPKSESDRHVLTLMSGTALAQAIPIAISPILTRIYTPKDFGLLALFMAITSTLAIVANGRYEMAIMLQSDHEDALNVAALGLVISTILFLLLLLLVIFFKNTLAAMLGSPEISNWLYLVPFTVFMSGLFNVLNYLNNRQKNYNDLAVVGILKSSVAASTQLALGFMNLGAGGLIVGQFFSNIFANTKLFRNATSGFELRKVVSKSRVIALASEYSQFPKYSMPAGLANVLSVNIVSFMLSAIYSVTSVGYYALARRVLGAPLTIIANSFGQVFFRVASEEYRNTGAAVNAFRRNLLKLTLFSTLGFALAFFFVKDAFILVFGQPWGEAGAYARIMMPLFMIRFIVSPLSVLSQIMDNKQTLIVNVALLIVASVSLLVSSLMELNIKYGLMLLCFSLSLVYITYLFSLHQLSKGKLNNHKDYDK